MYFSSRMPNYISLFLYWGYILGRRLALKIPSMVHTYIQWTWESHSLSPNSPLWAHFLSWVLYCEAAAVKWSTHLAATCIAWHCSRGSAPLNQSRARIMAGSWFRVKSRTTSWESFTLSKRECRPPHTALTVEVCLQACVNWDSRIYYIIFRYYIRGEVAIESLY